jgi:alpha/beta hydrolase fold
VPPIVENDPSLEFVELGNYKFHVRTVGDKRLPPVVVVHGGPGGKSKYLYSLQDLSRNHYVIFYDQRGTGLSPRVNKESLTLENSLDDLHRIVSHYGGGQQVKLIGIRGVRCLWSGIWASTRTEPATRWSSSQEFSILPPLWRSFVASRRLNPSGMRCRWRNASCSRRLFRTWTGTNTSTT